MADKHPSDVFPVFNITNKKLKVATPTPKHKSDRKKAVSCESPVKHKSVKKKKKNRKRDETEEKQGNENMCEAETEIEDTPVSECKKRKLEITRKDIAESECTVGTQKIKDKTPGTPDEFSEHSPSITAGLSGCNNASPETDYTENIASKQHNHNHEEEIEKAWGSNYMDVENKETQISLQNIENKILKPSEDISEDITSFTKVTSNMEPVNEEQTKIKRKRTRKRRSRNHHTESDANLTDASLVGSRDSSVIQNIIALAGSNTHHSSAPKNSHQNGTSHLGCVPGKLESPHYYRHGYRNLHAYKQQPSQHTTFNFDSDDNSSTMLTEKSEQYNFLPEVEGNMEIQEKELMDDAHRKMHNESVNSSKSVDYSLHERHDNKFKHQDTNTLVPTSKVTKDKSGSISGSSVRDSVASGNGPVGVREGSGVSPTLLERSGLPSGAVVYSRKRSQRRQLPELTKEEQLNTVATNRSFFLQSESSSCARRTAGEPFSVSPTEMLTAVPVRRDYTTLPSLVGPPRVGDRIAYKVLEVSADYTPEVSQYMEAEVISMDGQNIKLKKVSLGNRPAPVTGGGAGSGKFGVAMEDEDGEVLTNIEPEQTEVTIHRHSLLEPRLIT